MGEVLGLGISHFPGFMYPDHEMSARIKILIKNGGIVERLADVSSWPEPMQAEWGDDEGLSFAARHRSQFLDGARRLREELDRFAPDVVFIFGDDQYENFHTDIIPSFALYIRDDFALTPFLRGRGSGPRPNVWGRDPHEVINVKGDRGFGNHVARSLIDRAFDVPYCYEGLHLEGLGHAFYRAVLYLDYDMRGWPYPIQPVHVNAYGSHVASEAGSTGATAEYAEEHVPGPLPSRCFDLGRAIGRICKESDRRVALVASSSWSHAFLTEKNGFLFPDSDTDRLRFEQLRDGEYAKFASLSRHDLESAGEHEFLNWMPLFGAMTELEAGPPKWCDFLPTYVMNSNKCSVVFEAV